MDDGRGGGLRLKIRDGVEAQVKPDPLAIVHESATGVFTYLKSRPRSVPQLDLASRDLHASTRERLQNPPLTQGDRWATKVLAPGDSMTIDIFAVKRWNQTGLYLEADVEYRFEASGEWMDRNEPFTPTGGKQGGFSLADVAHHASDLLGQIETAYNKLRRTDDYDFWWTRRIETENWFALIGYIANEIGQGMDGLPEGETFLIGSAASFTPKAGGYLYAFANDAWQAYGNNRGSVALAVSRA